MASRKKFQLFFDFPLTLSDEECSGTNELYICEKESLIRCMGLSGSLF